MTDRYSYYAVYKPFGMLSQFTPEGGRDSLKSLADFPSDVYPVGRLDTDSEGLLLLTNDKRLNHRLLNPGFKHTRTYLVQVEGDVADDACAQMQNGINITVNGEKHFAKAIRVKKANLPEWLSERNPPIRFRKSIPTSWIEMVLTEGKNRQVRKMTAAVGFPTLRLVRTSIEGIELKGMHPGQAIQIDPRKVYGLLGI